MAGRPSDRPAGQPMSRPAPPPGASPPPFRPGHGRAPQAGEQTQRPAEHLGETVDQLKETSRQTAGSIAGQVRQQATTRLESQKGRATEGLGSVAQALRETGQHLREQDQAPVGQYLDQAAEQIERFSGYLRQRDVSQIVGEVESLARRQPALFLGAAFGLGFLATRFLKSSGQDGAGQGPAPVQKSIEVAVPVRTAYNQWTQFEEFPQFMEGIEEVRQLDDKRMHWKAQIVGKTEEWNAVITEQVPDQRIAWRNTTGAKNAGVVTFQPLGPDRTRVTLQLDYEPEGALEQIGSALGFVERRIDGDLERFKEFIEARGAATGAWRGEIRNEQVGRL